MFGSIDCAGILKLRNADIELRKGETDIGRKNTRVRLVFRVHIPESNGRIISLQAASNPIECCKYPLRFAPSPSLATTIVLSLCCRLALRGQNATCSDRERQGALPLLRWLGLCHRSSDSQVLPVCTPFPETSFDGRWLFTVPRACEDGQGLWGFCRVHLLVCCCWILVVRRSFLGAGSQRGCVCRGVHTCSLLVCVRANCLPSWEWFYFERRHNQNLLSTSWHVVGGFEFKPGPDPSPVAGPACQRSDCSPQICAVAGTQLKWRNRFDFEAQAYPGSRC